MLRIHCKIALCFLISLFDLSAILKIRNGEHAYYVGLVVAYTWNREKQMFVALGKVFDMCVESQRRKAISRISLFHHHYFIWRKKELVM